MEHANTPMPPPSTPPPSQPPAEPPPPEPSADPSPGSEPEPVLRPGREVAWREMTGCFVAYLLMAVAIIGLPLGIVFGLLTGEWRWLIPWVLVAIAVFVLGRLNKIPIFGD